jgi:hypothetical protein
VSRSVAVGRHLRNTQAETHTRRKAIDSLVALSNSTLGGEGKGRGGFVNVGEVGFGGKLPSWSVAVLPKQHVTVGRRAETRIQCSGCDAFVVVQEQVSAGAAYTCRKCFGGVLSFPVHNYKGEVVRIVEIVGAPHKRAKIKTHPAVSWEKKFTDPADNFAAFMECVEIRVPARNGNKYKDRPKRLPCPIEQLTSDNFDSLLGVRRVEPEKSDLYKHPKLIQRRSDIDADVSDAEELFLCANYGRIPSRETTREPLRNPFAPPAFEKQYLPGIVAKIRKELMRECVAYGVPRRMRPKDLQVMFPEFRRQAIARAMQRARDDLRSLYTVSHKGIGKSNDARSQEHDHRQQKRHSRTGTGVQRRNSAVR